MMSKTRAELEESLRGKSRAELVDLIFSLSTFEQLLTAREIAKAAHVSKRDVLAEMKAGRFVDLILGPGFFCRASNSLRVSVSAANAWRASFFARVDSIPASKKERRCRETDLDRGNSLAKGRRTVRDLSPAFMAGNGAK